MKSWTHSALDRSSSAWWSIRFGWRQNRARCNMASNLRLATAMEYRARECREWGGANVPWKTVSDLREDKMNLKCLSKLFILPPFAADSPPLSCSASPLQGSTSIECLVSVPGVFRTNRPPIHLLKENLCCDISSSEQGMLDIINWWLLGMEKFCQKCSEFRVST